MTWRAKTTNMKRGHFREKVLWDSTSCSNNTIIAIPDAPNPTCLLITQNRTIVNENLCTHCSSISRCGLACFKFGHVFFHVLSIFVSFVGAGLTGS